MKASLKTALLVIIYIVFFNSVKAQFGAMPPFTVQVEPINGTNIPGMHSFAFAQSGDKWLFIGGRTNGLHGINPSGAFDGAYINDNVTVVDTVTWQSYSATLTQLPVSIADPLRSTNMEYIQEGNYLYMIGGYGYDSIAQAFTTYPTLTAINIDSMINAVMNSLPIIPYIRQVNDTNFSIAGGELGKIGNDYYLIFGHDFEGMYVQHQSPVFTQTYSNRIKKFNITDNGNSITLSNFSYQLDTNNFHRRDFNTAPIVEPSGNFAIGAYGGVFQKQHNLPYQEPITIEATGAIVNTGYQQLMSHYTCAVMPIYDSVSQAMYTTFFGGISVNDYNHQTAVLVHDTLVPFIDDITTLTVEANGTTSEAVQAIPLSARLGANAKFIGKKNLAHYSNEVIKFRNLPNSKTFVGYMLGGIRANAGNLGITTSNDSVYRVYITPNFNVGINETSMNINNAMLFPNPTSQGSTLLFTLKNTQTIKVSLLDITGNEVELIANEKMNSGNHQLTISTSKLSSGVYICKIQSNDGVVHLSLIVN